MKNLLFIIFSITTIINLHAAADQALLLAMHYNNIEYITKHVSQENVNSLNEDGMAPLHYAVIIGRKEIIEILLNKKADPNIVAKPCLMTPLHYAAKYEVKDIVEILLKNGANRHAKDYNGKTPSDSAIEERNPEIAQFIDNYDDGRDIKQPDQES